MNQYRKAILQKTSDTATLIFVLAWLNIFNLLIPSANFFATLVTMGIVGLISSLFFRKEEELLKQWSYHGK
jgi:hypothetical protein